MQYHRIPRVDCEYPLGVDVPRGAEAPIRARDDLDPYDPPLEYADGRISWSGHPSREARDAARARRAAEAEHARAAEAARVQRALVARHQALVRRVRECPEHRVEREGDDYGFTNPIDGAEPNRAAHGGITRAQYCRCGARRSVNINQHHREVGPWAAPREREVAP